MNHDQSTRMQMTGTLARDAVVRIRPVGEHGVPMQVLCLELEGIGPGRHTASLEQVFPAKHPAAAHMRAAQLRKGMRVSFTARPADMHVRFPHVEHINVLQPDHPSTN